MRYIHVGGNPDIIIIFSHTYYIVVDLKKQQKEGNDERY